MSLPWEKGSLLGLPSLGESGQYRNSIASGWSCHCEDDPTLPRYGTDPIR